MSYRTYNIWILVMLILVGVAWLLTGYASRLPGLMEEIWWMPFALGGVILLGSLISIGFVATQPTKMPCPYCHEKVLPKVRMMSGHLHISRPDED
jgi:hypothetical protein